MLYFCDETGVNVVPPGMLVTVTPIPEIINRNLADDLSGAFDLEGSFDGPQASSPSTSVAPSQSGYTVAGGAVPAITLAAGTSYIASFYAERGPGGTQSFTAATSGDTIVAIVGYRSPYLSTSGGQQLQQELFPLDRANPNGAPNTFAIQMGLAARNAALDAQSQQVHGALRLFSSSGSAIDQWSSDFIGAGVWPRATNETDIAYIKRILLWLSTPFGTLYGLQQLTNAYLTAYVNPELLVGPLALDTTGALDQSGALDVSSSTTSGLPPGFKGTQVSVFDTISNPTLATAVGLVAAEAQFCVLFSFPGPASLNNWNLNQGFLGSTTFLASPEYYVLSQCPTPGLAAIINLTKPGGSQPVYAANQPSA